MVYMQQVDRPADGGPAMRSLGSGHILVSSEIAVALLATSTSVTAWAVGITSGDPVADVRLSLFHYTKDLAVRVCITGVHLLTRQQSLSHYIARAGLELDRL
jgi:hypothetical protein